MGGIYRGTVSAESVTAHWDLQTKLPLLTLVAYATEKFPPRFLSRIFLCQILIFIFLNFFPDSSSILILILSSIYKDGLQEHDLDVVDSGCSYQFQRKLRWLRMESSASKAKAADAKGCPKFSLRRTETMSVTMTVDRR